MKTKQRKTAGRRRYLPLILSSAALVAAIAIVIMAVLGGRSDDTYKMVQNAIRNTEAKKDPIIQLSSSSLTTGGGISQQVDTEGYIYTLSQADLTYVYVNTASSTSDESVEDFDVTVAMYSDGEFVYDNSTGKDVVIEDMTCEEFDEIVSEYGLYQYKKSDVTSVAFNENTLEGMENNGDMVVTLSRPNDGVMDALAQSMAAATGEEVDAEDLDILAASVTYSIYDEMVAGQTCNFTVSYQRADGETVQIASATHVLYLEEVDQEEIDTFIPIQEEDAK